jgi:predicted MFS family arabinose efflux permease
MPKTFARNGQFWLLALQVATVNFFTGGFGPSQALLREDQGTSLGVAGLHGTAMGVAAIIAGGMNSKLVHRFGRSNTTWLGLTVFSIGIVFFVFAPPVQLTLIATLIAGWGISVVINNVNTAGSHAFAERSHTAVAQINAVAIAGFVTGNFVIGSTANIVRDQWRVGMLITIPFILALFIKGRKYEPDSHTPDEDGPQRGKLSRGFWFSFTGFFISISAEFATSFWSASLISDRTDASAAISTLAVIAFGTGVGTGRWYAGRVLKRFHADEQLKIALGLQFVAFGFFWSSHILVLCLITLFFVGLGISVQFPLFTLRMVAFSEGRPDLAIGKSSIAAGIAIASSPLLLGILGDNFGISRAYIMVPVLIALGFLMVALSPSKHLGVNKI